MGEEGRKGGGTVCYVIGLSGIPAALLQIDDGTLMFGYGSMRF